MFWGWFECIFYDHNSRTGNDGAVRLLVCCLVQSSKERKLKSLKSYTFFFFGGGQAMGRAKVVFHFWSLICATLVNGQVCIKTLSANTAVQATQWFAIFRLPLACWDRGFESHRGHGYLPVVSVVCCQVEVSATSWSLVQRSPTDWSASLCVI